MAIDLNFNDEQKMIWNTAKEFFQKRCPPELARKYENSEAEFPIELWKEMADLGWLGMNFPAEYDGLDCTFLDVYGIYVEAGRTLAPAPLLEAIAIGGSLIARLGTEAQKQALLPGIAAGDKIVTLAMMEPEGRYGAEGVELAAKPGGGGYVLDGTKLLVACAGSAERLIVAARTGGSGEDGVSLFLVDPKAAGVSLERTRNIGGYPLYAVTFSNVSVPASDALGPVGKAWDGLNEVLMKAAVLQSAMVVGAGERVLEIAVGYAKDRVQFGTPIGKHQAVQYLCTDVAIAQHTTRLLTLHAAWKIDSGQPFLREAALAKASASKAAAKMTYAAHEVHAGIGFMIDYDLQLYTLRGKHWEFNLGDARHHLALAATQQLAAA